MEGCLDSFHAFHEIEYVNTADISRRRRTSGIVIRLLIAVAAHWIRTGHLSIATLSPSAVRQIRWRTNLASSYRRASRSETIPLLAATESRRSNYRSAFASARQPEHGRCVSSSDWPQ